MNKNRFRLIYNQARGLWMAVAETVKAHTAQGNNTKGNSTQGQSISQPPVSLLDTATAQGQAYALRPLTFNLMLVLGLAVVIPNPLNMPTAQADIIADQAAASTLRPMILSAANGTPLVNIQSPSAAGVSRNVYSQFDVNSNGVILNNSRTNIETQLGGWVQANPYLAGGAAKVILNEVNSQNPSLLNGYIEVAGSRAQVVIANPAGISCNGCGFINAHRATLTTGTPILNNGSLLGYRVGGGNIHVSGNGLDTSQANFTDVIARAVEVNAGIWASALNIVTGTNQVNVASNGDVTSTTPITPNATRPDGSANPTPNFAIDVAALGGMYAGKISMVGTEAGLGVRNAGSIGASAGEISITADGLLQNTGSLIAKTNIQLDTVALAGNGSIKADANITIHLDTDYTHTGELQAKANLNLQTSGNLINQSTLLASQSLHISAQNINNTATGEIVGTDNEINATSTLTNLGLIDGVNTHINANTLTNTQTGSLFGDHLSIKVANLSNTAGATIAARTQLDIGSATIENRSNGLMFSAGDIAIGGSLDNNHAAISTANSLINDGSTIEALGNATFSVTDLQNLNANFVTQVVQTGTGSFDRFTPRGQSIILESGDYPGAHIGNVNVEWRSAGPYTFREYTRYLGTKTIYETQVVSSTPGQILAGGDMKFSGAVLNSDSQMIAGGNLDVSGATVQNLNSEGQTITSYSGTAYYYDWDGNDDDYDVDVIGAYNPANTVLTYNLSTSRLEGSTTPTGSGTTVTSAAVPLVTGSLFQPSPNVAASYLIESNPRFTNYRNWLSSDYMLSQLSSDPATMQKRLGDGFYEQKLIREQINQLTGRRFLTGYTSDEAQYQALMDNGITTARALQLIPGVALTPEQTAQLTSDIMWLVEKTVTLPDGSTTQALVPQVYVKLQANDLHPTTGIMAGNSVTMQLSGDLVNQGTIAGRNFISLDAQNIQNLGGQIQADTTLLKASNDINIIGGQVIAKDAMLLEAGNDINLRSTTQSSQNSSGASSFSRTNLDRVAGLYMDNPNAILVANAGNDANLVAATIINRGEGAVTQINAAQDINLGTVTIAEQNSSVRNAKNYVKHGGMQDFGSTIQTNGDIALNAGNDVNAKAASITSETGAINVTATKDINITEGRETSNFDTARKVKKSGTFSSKTKTQRDVFESDNSISSNLSADNITLQAGNDLTIRGSNIVSDNSTTLNANNNINITSAQNTAYELHERKTKSSGLSTSGASVSLGTSKLSTKQTTQSTSQTGSTLGSVEGDVNINSGKTYTQQASDVLTPQGDINISAQQVNITSAQNTSQTVQETKFKQTGLTLAISNPVISAIQTAQQMSQAASQTGDGRMQALAAGTTALAAMNASDALGKVDQYGNVPTAGNTGPNDMTNVREANAADQVGGINISLSIGTSKSSSKTTQTSSTAQSSTLNAGGDITITAVRPELVEGQNVEAGQDSDINIIGSQVKANGNVTLKADDQINLQAAQNTNTLDGKNKSSSASLGISVGTTSGFAVTASASQGKGKTTGNGTNWTETIVQSGNQNGDKVTLESGTDTTIKGAQVIGNQVVANVGTSGSGNLNIESLQDTDQYKDKQKSAGISVSIPIGAGGYGGSISASSSKTKSDYASVNEQSGIMAGDDGFQVNVNGNTNLKGAVIASTDKAIQNNVNSLTTQTLTTSNIENSAEYSAKGLSVSAGVGLTQQPDGTGYKNTPTASAGSANLSDDSNSVTVSGISGGTVNITDTTTQQTNTGKDTATTLATLNRDVQTQFITDAQGNTSAMAVDGQGNNLASTLTPIFDKEQVQRELNAQIQITQAFSQVAPKAVGDYASNKFNELKNTSPEEAKKWDEGGVYRIALHTALGGLLTGDISGATGAGVIAGSADLLNGLQSKVSEALQNAGLAEQGANTISQALAELTSLGIGSAIGGTAGASTALAVDTNNRQLHQTEIDWIKKNAKAYAKYLNNGNKPTLQQIKIAEDALADQAFRQVQFGVAGEWDAQAHEFLNNATKYGGVLAPDLNFPNSGYTTMFYASPAERANAAIYLDSAINNAAFYQQHQLAQPTVAQIKADITDYAKKHDIAVNATIAAIALPPSLILGTLASAPAVTTAVTNFIRTAIASCTGNLVLCVNQAAIEAAGLVEGAPITTTIAAGASAKAAQEVKLAVTEERAAASLFKQDRKFWTTEAVDFNGSSVYQRNDLINPARIDNKTGLSNLELMKMGRAPIGPDGKSINLHHLLQSNDGPIAEVTQTFHQSNSATIHINSGSDIPSGINRAEFDKWRTQYWIDRAKDF